MNTAYETYGCIYFKKKHGEFPTFQKWFQMFETYISWLYLVPLVIPAFNDYLGSDGKNGRNGPCVGRKTHAEGD